MSHCAVIWCHNYSKKANKQNSNVTYHRLHADGRVKRLGRDMDNDNNQGQGGARRREPAERNWRIPLARDDAGNQVEDDQQYPPKRVRSNRTQRQPEPNNRPQNRIERGPNNRQQNRKERGSNCTHQNRYERDPYKRQQMRCESGPNDRQQNGASAGLNERLNRHDTKQNRTNWCMGFRTLDEIASSEDSETILKITEKKTSFLNLLESNIEKGDIYVLVLKIISKVCLSCFEELKLKLLLEICNSQYMKNLRIYLIDLPDVEDKSKNKLYWNDQTNFWSNFVAFCECIVNLSPSTSLKCRSLIEGTSKQCLEELQNTHGYILPNDLKNKLNLLRERLALSADTKPKVSNQCELKKGETNMLNEHLEPPDDFRNLSVLPTREDLLVPRPFLRPNIINGGYRNTEHYLDVQFRLLREDCFGPLRDGINQYLENHNKKKYDNIRVYHNVKFVEPFISTNKIGELIKLDETAMKRMKKINWAHSKRFIYGSLLLFTKDNCKNFFTGTILERDVKLLTKGMIPVSIVDKGNTDDIYRDDSLYTMIESNVYFEPYFHVLKALQDISFPENLAMAQYIVNVDPTPNPPCYLNPDSKFAVQTDSEAKTKFTVLEKFTWPAMEDLGLNESQYEAYNLALTHEFAVIQGPPGTGKTFLGVKIAKTLLENLPTEKMLIICYTNHALDQFLEAILPVTESIVRIGGQSRNDAMKKLNLSELRRNADFSSDAKRLFFEQKKDLKAAAFELQHGQKQLESIFNGILSYDSLKTYVPEVKMLGQYYTDYRSDVKTDPLKHWLQEGMHHIDFNTITAEEIVADNNDENTNVYENVDEDEERFQIILDDFEDLEFTFQGSSVVVSFSVSDVEKKLKTLLLLCSKIYNRYKQQELKREIADLKSQLNLFNEMSANRARETLLQINNTTHFDAVPMQDRWSTYFKWANIVLNVLKKKIQPLQEALNKAYKGYEEARMMVDVKIIKKFKVIGMTTTGAARLRKLLQTVAPSIVIVEEAAEVLEQHIVTSLTKDCKHLILIGDHQQLRPSAAHMRLAREYNIEVSLFERMISNGMHSRRLAVQHRMRPELAALIAPHIYPDLANHPTTEHFPKVRGIPDDLFFFTHNYKEQEVEETSSKSNQLEADMTLKLANYLMQQGYEPGDVTILAAYSGQMFYMRKQREKYFYLSKVKITVVDNYQGEESKIILLSLVRNNDQNKIGFLGTENRVCVALSRAREGFFILGNIEILKRNSKLWEKIATTLQNSGSLGSAIMLKCENHSDQITMITSPKDFDKVPEGGCLMKCGFNLPCGHRCPLICHGYDRGHVNTKCYEKCERELCDLKHICPLICSVKCEPCKRLMEKVLPCEHKMQVHCFKDPADPTIKCLTTVTAILPSCGHEVKKSCFQKIETVKCPVLCKYRVQNCGHECRLKCHVNDDPDHENYACHKPCAKAKKGCTANLIGDRGDHQCQKKCYETCDDCTVETLKKRSNCKHSERVGCNEDVDNRPCRKNCARMLPCQHFCKKKCYEECGDCNQKVTKLIPDCNHQIQLMCKDPATRELCTQACERVLSCGHPCTQQCGTPCDSSKCTELIDDEIMAPCGHRVKLPCNIYTYNRSISGPGPNSLDGEVLLKHCTEPCGQWLACEHPCAGTCSGCRQGRLHEACKGTCGRLNICGHQCNEPCNQVCPPCKNPCETKCPHSQCNQLCGAPCTLCQEDCTRGCPHSRCVNRCGEPCSRKACDEPCPLELPCGHRCRGLCGEPCPDICKICRPDQFPKDFLGYEFEDNEKFVTLQDCGHVLDVESLECMMLANKKTIEIRTCPFCRKPIINTYRYKDLVNHMFKVEINPVKIKVYGDKTEIEKRRQELFDKMVHIIVSREYDDIFGWCSRYKEAVVKMHKIIKVQKMPSLVKLNMQFQYLEILNMIAECYRKFKDARLSVMEKELLRLVNLLCSVLSKNIQKISLQLQYDVANEIKRINSIIQLAKMLSHPTYTSLQFSPKVKEAAETAKKEVLSWQVFNQDKVIVLLKAFQEAIKVSGIVTKEERDLIVKALGAKIGSWYKCPNGHPYGIDQCGGAMQISKCVDCGAPIGGTHHRLLPDNMHAREMDGSSFPAWSNEYNNMENWEL